MTTALLGAMMLLAQPVLAQDVLDILAGNACECISKKDTDQMSMEDLQMQLSMCLMESVGKNQEAFTREYGELDISDQAAMQDFAQKIAMRMVTKCPQVMMKVASTSQGMPQSSETPKTATILEGVFQGVSGSEMAVIEIKEANGRTQKLLWMSYFQGSDQLISNPASLKGKAVTVEYETIEVYSPKAKEYFDRKKITSLKVQ